MLQINFENRQQLSFVISSYQVVGEIADWVETLHSNFTRDSSEENGDAMKGRKENVVV